MTVKTPLEARLYAALHRIAREYMTVEQMERQAEKEYGLSPYEGVAMAYDNLQSEARDAIKGVRFPKPKATPASTDQPSEAR
jgi:hypothetical protein